MTRDEQELQTYLDGVVWLRRDFPLPPDFLYRGASEFLHRHGQFWTLPASSRPAGISQMRARHCFYNAYLLAKRRPDLTYVEGIATAIIPVDHAWVVDGAGQVIDPTWEPGAGRAYFGVAFATPDVIASQSDHNCTVLHDWPHGFPVLRGRIRPLTGPKGFDGGEKLFSACRPVIMS